MVKESALLQRLGSEPHITGFVYGNGLEDSTGCYFGIGLSNKSGLTEQLPFDALGLVLTAELVRERAELEKVTVLIADEHAASSNNRESVRRVAGARRDFVQELINKMDLKQFNIVFGSEVARPEVHGLNGNRYETLQVGDMEFFRQNGSGVKVGWKYNGMDFDERRFDDMYTSIFGPLTSFIYTEPGRSLDGFAMPPYLCTEKPRLLFQKGEDIDYKVDQMTKETRAYFIRLLDLYSKVVCGHSGVGRNSPDKLKRRLKEVYSVVYGNGWQ